MHSDTSVSRKCIRNALRYICFTQMHPKCTPIRLFRANVSVVHVNTPVWRCMTCSTYLRLPYLEPGGDCNYVSIIHNLAEKQSANPNLVKERYGFTNGFRRPGRGRGKLIPYIGGLLMDFGFSVWYNDFASQNSSRHVPSWRRMIHGPHDLKIKCLLRGRLIFCAHGIRFLREWDPMVF